jgi:TPR repeat protein
VKNEAEAARCYKLAADQHHTSAQFTYALCLANRKVVATNEAESARYFKLAADQNHASAELNYAPSLPCERESGCGK